MVKGGCVARGDAWQGGRRVARERHDKGGVNRRDEREKSGQQMKRKSRKTNQVAAASRFMFMSRGVRRARICEK